MDYYFLPTIGAVTHLMWCGQSEVTRTRWCLRKC